MTKEEKEQEMFGRLGRLTEDMRRGLVDGGEDRYMHSGEDVLVLVIINKACAKELFPIADAMFERWDDLEEIDEKLKEEAARALVLQITSGDTSEK